MTWCSAHYDSARETGVDSGREKETDKIVNAAHCVIRTFCICVELAQMKQKWLLDTFAEIKLRMTDGKRLVETNKHIVNG